MEDGLLVGVVALAKPLGLRRVRDAGLRAAAGPGGEGGAAVSQSEKKGGKGLWHVVTTACILLAFPRAFGRIIFGIWLDVVGNAVGAGRVINADGVMHRGHENCQEKDQWSDGELWYEVNNS